MVSLCMFFTLGCAIAQLLHVARLSLSIRPARLQTTVAASGNGKKGQGTQNLCCGSTFGQLKICSRNQGMFSQAFLQVPRCECS